MKVEDILLTGFADEIDPMLDKQMTTLRQLGLSYLDTRGIDGRGVEKYTASEARTVRERLDAEGLKVASVASPIGKIRITDDFAEHMEVFKRVVETAHIFGTDLIRMFSFFIPGNTEDEAYKYRDEVMDRLGAMRDYACAENVVLLHENEKGIYGDSIDRCLDIMKNLYSDNFKAVFDFANFVQCGQDTLKAYDVLKSYIAYVHVKDALADGGVVTPAGRGDGHVKEILGMMYRDGYKGFLSLEPHLSLFDGFLKLENDGKLDKSMEGATAFKIAHDALMDIIKEI